MKNAQSILEEAKGILEAVTVLVSDLQAIADAPAIIPAPVVEPTDTEVDVVLSDGTTKTFVPKV